VNGYDEMNRLISASESSFTYDPTGRVISTRDSDGSDFGASYDDGGRLKTVTYDNGALTVTYAYDPRDLLIRVTNSLTTATMDYTYNADSRLTGVTRAKRGQRRL
jgi:YD repeat-containing protein